MFDEQYDEQHTGVLFPAANMDFHFQISTGIGAQLDELQFFHDLKNEI